MLIATILELGGSHKCSSQGQFYCACISLNLILRVTPMVWVFSILKIAQEKLRRFLSFLEVSNTIHGSSEGWTAQKWEDMWLPWGPGTCPPKLRRTSPCRSNGNSTFQVRKTLLFGLSSGLSRAVDTCRSVWTDASEHDHFCSSERSLDSKLIHIPIFIATSDFKRSPKRTQATVFRSD